MTKDYMLTVWSAGLGPRDIQVNNAPDMHTAIRLAERQSGCRVDHGRSNVGPQFDPAVIIDAETGDVDVRHDRVAAESMTVVQPRRKVVWPRG